MNKRQRKKKMKFDDFVFEDTQGRRITLPGSLTIADLVRRRITTRITKDEPLPPGWYRAIGTAGIGGMIIGFAE